MIIRSFKENLKDRKMLKSLLILFAALFISFPAYADDIPESDVPQTVKDNFYSRFDAITVKWDSKKGNFKAEFYENGIKKEVIYTPSGKLVKLEYEDGHRSHHSNDDSRSHESRHNSDDDSGTHESHHGDDDSGSHDSGNHEDHHNSGDDSGRHGRHHDSDHD